MAGRDIIYKKRAIGGEGANSRGSPGGGRGGTTQSSQKPRQVAKSASTCIAHNNNKPPKTAKNAGRCRGGGVNDSPGLGAR
jgi:hypothetical protein